MSARSSLTFAAEVRDLRPEEVFALTAVAAEERVGASVLASLGLSDEGKARLLARHFLLEKGHIRPVSLRAGLEEPAFETPRPLRQWLLRKAAADGILPAVVQECQKLLGARSQSVFALKVQSGTLLLRGDEKDGIAFDPRLAEALTEPFDPDWLLRTWKEQTPAIISRVLGSALVSLEPVDELYFWAARSLPEELSAGNEALHEILVAHALHREHALEAESLASSLTAGTRLAVAAISHYQRDARDLAKDALAQCLAFGGLKKTFSPAFGPLLALLLLEADAERNEKLAQRIVASRENVFREKGATRAFRTFLRYRHTSEARLTRIDPFQLSKSASAWEVLLLGLTVELYLEQSGTRAAWAELLRTRAALWSERGYPWMSRQATLLARRMAREPEAERREASLSDAGSLTALNLGDAPWQRSLAALKKLVPELIAPSTKSRVEWNVSVAERTLGRPGLQEFRPNEGWTTIRRVSLEELAQLREDLPEEDQRVLESGSPLESLVGHPRVVDPTQAGLSVDVVRGSVAIEADDDGADLRIRVTPEGLAPGVNLIADGQRRLKVITVTPALEQMLSAFSGEVRVPIAQKSEALSLLGQLSLAVRVKSQHIGGERSVVASSVPCLRFLPIAGTFRVEAGVRPFGEKGRFFAAGEGPRIIASAFEGNLLRSERDLEEEVRRVNALIAACPTLVAPALVEDRVPGDPRDLWFLGEKEILPLLSEVKTSGIAVHFEWPEGGAFALRGSVNQKSLSGALRAQKGWYLVRGSVEIDKVTSLSLQELMVLPTVGRGRYARLPNGDYVEIEARVRRVLAALAASGRHEKNRGLRIPSSAKHALSLLAELPEIEADELTRARLREAQDESLSLAVPKSLAGVLRSYQEEGFRWLVRLSALGFGACLADDMGLGKTLQVIAFLLQRPPSSFHLVVAPTSVCTNWLREFARFAPDLRVEEYVGFGREKKLEAKSCNVLIVSYALLHEDAHDFRKTEFDTVILDEGQFIKNPHSQRARAAFSLSAKNRIVLSGTPVENHLGDLWSIFHFLCPDLLGSWDSFQTFFVKPIERDGDSLVRESLREIVRPYLLRRTKNEVLKELPALTTIRHELELGEDEALRYALLRRQLHEKLRTVAGKRQNKLEILAEVTRLRRFCCHPRLVFPGAPSESRKIDALIELLRELGENDHRTLVFSQYVDFLEMIRERLEETAIFYEYLDGSTPKAKRQQSVDAFQAGTAPVFLISLKAGGFGLNLTAADYVVHLDPWWNPAVEAQATDRAHRIGQTRAVTVYQFVTKDTIEEDILALHQTKLALAKSVLAGSADVADLKSEDLVAWLEKSFASRGASGLA